MKASALLLAFALACPSGHAAVLYDELGDYRSVPASSVRQLVKWIFSLGVTAGNSVED